MTVIGETGDVPEQGPIRPAQTLDIKSLNEFSAECAEFLFGRHPEWRQFATAEDGILWVQLPSPVSGRTLSISTFNNEVTLFFFPGIWHEHFDPESLEMTAGELCANALEWLEGIFAEEILIRETRTLENKTSSWGTVPRGEKVKPQRGRKIVLMSWRGTYDRELAFTWRNLLPWIR